MHIKPKVGSDLTEEIRKCVGIATMLNEAVWMTFNGIKIVITSGTSVENTYAEYQVAKTKYENEEKEKPKGPQGPLKKWLKDPEYRKAHDQERLLVQFWEKVLDFVNQEGSTTEILAEEAGIPHEELTCMMGGEAAVTLRTVSDLCLALGCRATIRIEKVDTDK